VYFKINSSTKETFNNKPLYRSIVFKLYSAPNNFSSARLGIQITKKAVHLAVIRNQIRRKIKANFSLICDLLPKDDYLVVISSKITSDKHQISDILMQEWKKSTELLLKSQ
jgi:ribonuclease P protein component